ncbi:hypothetical protein ACLB2K_009689 [Fragaria x ananassa]
MEVVASLEDLLTEILVRVPARPLIRFKCVSKQWLSLISDPKFCHRHTLQNPRSSVSAVFPDRIPSSRSTAVSFIPLDDLDHDTRTNQSSANCNPLNLVPNFQFPNLHDEINIIHSCNGLFLCRGRLEKGDQRYYYVLNPTTNQFSTLIPPAATTSGQSCNIINLALAFDPSKSPHYKVLVVFWINDPNNPIDIKHMIMTHRLRDINLDFHIDVYSSETKSWRHVDSTFSIADSPNLSEGVYCNGALHWVKGRDKKLTYYHIDDDRVGHVDQPAGQISHPNRNLVDLCNSWRLQESHCGSHLHLIDIYSSRIEVSKMKRDYSGWFLKYTINLDDRIFTSFWNFVVLFLTPEETEGDECSSLLLHIPGQVISYNLKSKISKSFRLTPRQGTDDSELRVKTERNFRYMESLACV